MKAKILAHNKKVLAKAEAVNTPAVNVDMCNCQKRDKCVLKNNCLVKNSIYRSVVHNITESCNDSYTGLAAKTFKERLTNHTNNFKYEKHIGKTTPSLSHLGPKA